MNNETVDLDDYYDGEFDERETVNVYEQDRSNQSPPPSPPPPPTKKTPSIWGYRLLWVLVAISLGLNSLFLMGMFNFRMQARQQVERVSTILQTSEFDDISWNVQINERLPVSITVPFSDTFQVPLSITIPVSTSVLFEDVIEVPINTVLPINIREIGAADTPLLNLEFIPLSTFVNVPVNLMVNVPISREIPVETDIPVDLLVEIPVSTTVPIHMDIPVILDIPVTVPLDELGFQKLLNQVQEALNLLAELLGALPER